VLQARIEDLLRFNAAAFEARRLVRRNTELGELAQRLVDEQKLQWQARQLWIEIEGAPVYVQADPDKLGTALGNLLSNAIRFSPERSTIRIDLSQQGDVARIVVSDAGPGIAAVDQSRVFEPFYRGERQPEDAVKGTGIGLSIVHEYVAAHGGTVRLLPEGPGARFQIELPHAVRD
jgi:two-component system, NtrC family, sensor histidine kinase GlrK